MVLQSVFLPQPFVYQSIGCFNDFISFQINTAPKNVNVISQEDFAKLRSNAKRKSSTGEAIPATAAAGPVAAATHAQPTTPQNTPAVGSMKVPPSVRVEELEGTTLHLPCFIHFCHSKVKALPTDCNNAPNCTARID